MFAFPGMIANTAREAGIKVPEKPDEENWSRKDYPHFYVLCEVQLGRPINMQDVQEDVRHNSKLIASYSEDEIKSVTAHRLLNDGLKCLA